MKPVPVSEAQNLELLFHDELLKLTNNRLLQEMYRISSEIFNPVIAKLYNYTAEGIDDTEWPLSHTYFLEALRKRDIFLAYQVSLNLIPVKKIQNRFWAILNTLPMLSKQTLVSRINGSYSMEQNQYLFFTAWEHCGIICLQ